MKIIELLKKIIKKGLILVQERINSSISTENRSSEKVDFDHLTPEGELPFGWVYRNREFTVPIHSEYSYFLNMLLESRNKAPKELYSALKSFILYLEDVEKLCKSKGECFEFWFYGNLTSKERLQKMKDELAHITENFDEIEKNFYKKQTELVDLDERIIKLLKDNPGIIQADFVKLFDATVQAEVKEKLYYMDKEGYLQRIKTGRSYTLNYRG